MEKYRRFADEGTGIQPFVPMRGDRSPAQLWVVGPLCALLRAPFLLLAAALFLTAVFVSDVVGACIPPVGALLRMLMLRPCALLLTALLGIRFDRRAWPVTTAGAEAAAVPQSGEVVLSNHSSYVDILYYAGFCAPLFAWAVEDPATGDVHVITRGTLGALRFAQLPLRTAREQLSAGTSLDAAVEKAAARRAPLVLFFEGTQTNGKGVLAPPRKLLGGCAAKTQFHLHALVYHDVSSKSASDHFPLTCDPSVVSPRAHFAALVATPLHAVVKAVAVLPSRTPQHKALPDAPLLQKALIAKLCEASGLRPMALALKDKAPFLDHWESTQGKAYL